MTVAAAFGARELDRIFPFHFIMDEALRIVSRGPALDRIVPGLDAGGAFADFFTVARPILAIGFDSFAQRASSLFLIEVRGRPGLVLKGQICALEHGLLSFLGSPWVTTIGRLKELGLSLKDFAIHDPVGDYLILLQAQQTAIEDASRLAAQLEDSHRTLQTAYARLEEETERRQRTERELRHAQRLQSLGQLASGAAHEFNNLLTPMLCLTEVVRDELADGALRDDLDAVIESCQRAAKLISNMLTLGRRAEAPRARVDLNELVDRAVQLLRATTPTTIELVYRAPADRAVFVNAEPTQLHQVLLNLASNARHAIGDRPGAITIALDAIDLDGGTAASGTQLAPGRYARVTLDDTGCGIDSTTLDHVFDPFFTTKVVGEGTGLGLSIVHGIIANHGGRIAVHSRVGHGTRFTIDLPAVEVAIREVAPGPLANGSASWHAS